MMTFADFSLDPARRQVAAADGKPLHLTPKAFDLLQLLLEEAPRVVPKAELHRRLWLGTFVTDAALTSLVKELRRVLRERDRAKPLVKTAHGVGYACDDASAATLDPQAGVHWLVGRHQRYALKPGVNTIGRDRASDVWLDEADVSRCHARILIAGDAAAIEDLGGKNGTAVGLSAVSGSVVKDGDSVRAGGVPLTYRRQVAGGSTETLVAR